MEYKKPTKVSKKLQQNNSENDKEIPKEIYIHLQKKGKRLSII